MPRGYCQILGRRRECYLCYLFHGFELVNMLDQFLYSFPRILMVQTPCSLSSFIQLATQDEKTNLHQICLVQICCKYELCTALHPVQVHVVMAEFARFCANSAIATFALVAKICEFHICNIFAPGKFGANSISIQCKSRQYQSFLLQYASCLSLVP